MKITPPVVALLLAGSLATLSACGPNTSASHNPNETTAGTQDSLKITVTDGRAVGGLQEFSVHHNDAVTLTVNSTNTTDRVHLHGYDVLKNLTPSNPVVISFTANIEGVFTIELENTLTKLADLTVK